MSTKEKKPKKYRGMILVFEGTEGAGKTTQSELLLKTLLENGYRARRYKFPTNGISGSLAYAYLKNEIDSEALNGYQAATLYLADMLCYAKEINDAADAGEIVIIDRYVSTNFYNQSVRSINAKALNFEMELKKFIHEIKDMAYNKMSIPRPDTTIFLQVSYDKSKNNRDNDSTRTVKDFHERNEQYVATVTKTAVTAAKLERWKVINCDDKSIEEVHENIMDIIDDELKRNALFFNLNHD